MTSKHRKAFEEFAEKAKEELGDSLKKLVLYGSVARGEETEESDVDIFAVVESRSQKRNLEQLAAEIGVEYGVLFSAIVKTEKDYKEMEDSSFSQEVRDTGEVYV
ncbi:MAG: nucleotidyltransferase domain-containing protein [Candidatus Nanohalobium sp.]